jgi:hypothetical protein
MSHPVELDSIIAPALVDLKKSLQELIHSTKEVKKNIMKLKKEYKFSDEDFWDSIIHHCEKLDVVPFENETEHPINQEDLDDAIENAADYGEPPNEFIILPNPSVDPHAEEPENTDDIMFLSSVPLSADHQLILEVNPAHDQHQQNIPSIKKR